ncbi:hypothetical protein UFOVP236_15 [uncultured Caudovirales phage]|uniref:Uncharacterized protein n=1 Tax=uncultured Caudovirales phage TaxID=2100421 RepID=A0A6J7WUB0_9CAUD|nr:hypothetical protein UFOVP236_15 [uncultured Caudovirales phage]
MRKQWGETATAILVSLKNFGPMTRKEMCDHLGLDRMNVSAIMTRLTKRTQLAGKRIYIKAYVYDSEGERRYPRAIYALGDKPDVKKPKSNPKENKRRYLAGLQMRYKTNSVFNLAMTRRQYQEQKNNSTAKDLL